VKVSRTDVLGPRRYEPIREDYRKRVIQLKKDRRISVGDRVTLVFENRDTLLFQIEEMLRAEAITEEAKIQEEIDVYNALMPSADELSATLFLENPRDADPKVELHRFVGIDEHVMLVIGEHRVRAWFEPGRQEADRISAVQYTRYRLPPEAKVALRAAGTACAIEIDHPSYRARAELTESMRASLAKDLDA
jgi:hypothetical protein